MLNGLRSFLIGYHNPIVHTYYVTRAWKKIFGTYPDCREFICIVLHDIGYIKQNDAGSALGTDDRHPQLGADICGVLFGKDYYDLCIGHSRDYSKIIGCELSALCYADKYSPLLMPWAVHRVVYLLDSPDVDILVVKRFRRSCERWWGENGWQVD